MRLSNKESREKASVYQQPDETCRKSEGQIEADIIYESGEAAQRQGERRLTYADRVVTSLQSGWKKELCY